MALYLIIIAIANIIIITFNCLFLVPKYNTSVLYIILATVFSTIAVILIDLFFAWLSHAFPKKWVDHNKKIFTVSKKEKNFYEKLKIKTWKEKIPELGVLCNFRKNKIAEPSNNEYVEKFLYETIYGGICHINGVIFGPLAILILPLQLWCYIGIYVVIVNTILNLMPLFVLRYNRYKLKIVYNQNERLSKKTKKLQNNILTA